MNHNAQFENRASRSRSKHEGESSYALCDRLSRTRDTSQRQLPTDQDYAVSTREYQTDQSSPKPVPTAAGPVLGKRQKQRQKQRQPHRCAAVDRVTPYQSFTAFNLSAFVITDTELKLIAAAAIIGFSSNPKIGYRTPAASGTPSAL